MKICEMMMRLEDIASNTHHWVGADFAQLCAEAALPDYVVAHDHFVQAMGQCNPSLPREMLGSGVEIPNITWDAIGGLEQIKREI